MSRDLAEFARQAVRTTSIILVTSILSSIAVASACSERFPKQEQADSGLPAQVDGGPPALEAQPPAKIAADKQRDATSSPVVFDAERGGVWTANGDVGTVSYVDVDKRAVVQEIAVGKDVRSVALSPDARFVAAVDREGAQVTLIDAESRVVLRAIALGSHPRAAVWDAADPRWLYVAVEDDNAVALIDRTRGELVREVSVGRLPSGLAVSRQRPELYVTHRVDGRVTILTTGGGATPFDPAAPLVELTLADEPATDDPKAPHGKPFAFESLAWAPNGNVAWLPHELLAPTHPFQFQTTLFPAVSVVDLAARAEVQTDPNAMDGVIAGRKNLFAAINLPDASGNINVLSQPCAAALHPNGFVAYAIACASEDLLTFDTTSGAAVDLLRNLPGDHPVGITLDDTGARAFVIADQSHTLSIVDTAGGSLLKHAALVGDPIALAAHDPVDPEMREGLKLFFRATSAKGALAATGNNWMSCGGCHLDGFVSTNLALFEDAQVNDPAQDAQIGHVGLKDFFSTAPTPSDPTFNPHDVLVAFTDQGGLAPDRTGASRAHAIDPSAPTPDARTMAARVARVIARDLPLGPSWLLPGADKPNADYDGAWCGKCHQAEYLTWKKSVHARSADDPMVTFGARLEQQKLGEQYSRLCAGCHDPVSARLGDTTLASKRGITCIGCHDTERLIRAGGNADIEAKPHDWTVDHKARAKAGLATLRDPEFCGGCHQQFVPATGLEAISTLHEWQRSIYAGAQGDIGSGEVTRCVDCHAEKTEGVADHTMIGGNVYMAKNVIQDDAMAAAEQAKLQIAMVLEATRVNDVVLVKVKNRGAGHSFPTGVTDLREPWVELQAMRKGESTTDKAVARYGGPGADGLLPASAARLGLDIASSDGTILLKHELSETTRIPFDRRVPAFGETDLVVKPPAALPPGADHLDAVLIYRNVRTPYFRAAVGDSSKGAAAPDVEVARVTLAK